MSAGIPDLARPAPLVAPRLLGCRLRVGAVCARISEVEAYHGEEDRACHASRGRTPRAAGLYREPGALYVYLCYGIHHLLNLVTDRIGVPSAVLIRGVSLLAGESLARERRGIAAGALARLTNGPGKVTQALGLGAADHGGVLGEPGCRLELLPPLHEPVGPPVIGSRVGVDYAGSEWAVKPWRWWEPGFPAAK
ncbi:MAG: DNA-3-methyladenine glycosylase [Planctomycetota bacterium]